jgi:plastocyanin
MLHRCRPAQLLPALLIMIVPVSLAEAKAPATPAASPHVRPSTATATTTNAQAAPAAAPAPSPAPPPAAPPTSTASVTPPPAAATPVIVTAPQQVRAGAVAVLEIQNPPAGATDYRWDLDGSGSFATDTGALTHVTHDYAAPGRRQVTVRITTATGTRTVTLAVRVAPAAGSASHDTRTRARPAPAGAGLLAHTSSDPADTISDFMFTPASLTIHVGDTITWANRGPAPHSATAYDHSFDTGVLQKGQSGSHTFTTAGTFTYFCSVHPFMHGTVVVLAAPSSTSGSSNTTSSHASASSNSSPTTTTPTATVATDTTGQLPLTGFDVVPRLLVGLLLLAAGVTLRRVAARRS